MLKPKTQYPKAMYRGDFNNPEYLQVRSEDAEAEVRQDGFFPGHEFFSKPSKPITASEIVEMSASRRPGRPRKLE